MRLSANEQMRRASAKLLYRRLGLFIPQPGYGLPCSCKAAGK